MNSGMYQPPGHVESIDGSFASENKRKEKKDISSEDMKAAHDYLDKAEKKLPERKYTEGFNIKHNPNNNDFEVTNDLNDGPFNEVKKIELTGEEIDKVVDTVKRMEEEKNPIEEEDINHPKRYRPGVYEAINVIEAWELNFALGSVVKYVARLGLKDDPRKELKKAIWYLQRELSKYE